jgi:hypothetical protein
MFNANKQFIARFVILIMAISPVQITIATDFDQHGTEMNCQISSVSSPAPAYMNIDDNCGIENSSHCVDLSVCAAQTNFISLRSSGPLIFSPGVATLLKFTTDNQSISTNYPELLRRPPKV